LRIVVVVSARRGERPEIASARIDGVEPRLAEPRIEPLEVAAERTLIDPRFGVD